MDDLSSTTAKATAFTKSYAAAMELKLRQSSATIQDIAAGLASHYNPDGFVAFILGKRQELRNDDAGIATVEAHLERIAKHGLGVDVRLEKFRVEPMAVGTALCWMTWTIYPPSDSGVESWSWENIYSYRELLSASGQPTGKEYWEFVVSDNEVAGLLKRVPDFFSS